MTMRRSYSHRVVAMMQFNMYHHYTVDEHIIQTISTLSKIERGDGENFLELFGVTLIEFLQAEIGACPGLVLI